MNYSGNVYIPICKFSYARWFRQTRHNFARRIITVIIIDGSLRFQDVLMLCWSYSSDDRPDFGMLLKLLERLPKKRLARSPSHPIQLSRSAESVFWMSPTWVSHYCGWIVILWRCILSTASDVRVGETRDIWLCIFVWTEKTSQSQCFNSHRTSPIALFSAR